MTIAAASDLPIGTKLGQLTVISPAWKLGSNRSVACVCDCGGAHIATVRFMRAGKPERAMCKRCWGARMLDARKSGPRRRYDP